ncbi:MAG: GNAT family N-acetyltransferase [Ignavibacteriaceae bacterium]|nr:GNAT family N-acetyltransferase [Ignavibacteria bacterium]MBT8390592.1 GNAT family N-acetyltransferase [Ignavibacteria bacterium]NNL22379.1 GNAT family N-acetyltransferase [Ignavibacteriaceae bacterium]
MEIIEYSEKWKEKWDQFVIESNNGTIFHMQKFFNYHTPGKFTFNHLIFLEKGNVVALLPGSRIGDIYESPIGASYGSIVTKDVKFAEAMEIISTLIEYGKKIGLKELLLTSAPRVYEKHQNENLDFAMLWQGFNYDLHYISSAIKLDAETDIILRFQQTVRRNIRKSLKNPEIRIEINERYDEFYPILIENKARHDVKPTHSLEDLIKLNELFPDSLKLFMIYYKDKPIAGSSVFICNEIISLCFYNMLLYEYEHLKPIHRVMYEVVKWSTENGYKYLDIGVSQDTKADNPMTPSMGLIDFKEKFDAKTVMRNTFRKEL